MVQMMSYVATGLVEREVVRRGMMVLRPVVLVEGERIWVWV